MKKKERLKTKPANDDGWNTEDWGPEITSSSSSSKSSKKTTTKDPLVGNLLDLDLNDESTAVTDSGANNSGWDNDVWADGDDDEWQSLELDSKKK